MHPEKVPTLQAWVMHDLEGAHRCVTTLYPYILRVILGISPQKNSQSQEGTDEKTGSRKGWGFSYT